MADVLTLDPGVTIGMCLLDEPASYEQRQLVPTDYPHPHETLFDVLSEIKPKKIIYERFDFRAAKNGVILTGVEFIGVIELYAQLNCIEILKMSASDGKAFWSDVKLKAMGLHKRGMPHANDATRIMLTYRMKTDKIWWEEILKHLRNVL